MKLILPIVLALVGLAGGLFGGQALKPPPEDVEGDMAETAAPDAGEEEAGMAEKAAAASGDVVYEPPPPKEVEKPENTDFVRLEKQFVVPVIEGSRVTSLMVMSLALEVGEGGSDLVFAHEPKLRDELLRALFVHAQSGGFSGQFTRPHLMDDLKSSLGAAARTVLGEVSYGVLVTNIVRQDQ